MGLLLSFIIGLVAIAALITIHESGHFLFARLVGIEVETFAIGWGKTVYQRKKGATTYKINMFPLGGYCQLKGSEELKAALEAPKGAEFKKEKGSLFAAHPFKRIVVFLGGSLCNFIFAIVLLIPFFSMSYETISYPNKIVVTSDYPKTFGSETTPSAAKLGGLQSGDYIESINSVKINSFSDIQKIIEQNKEEPLHITLTRDGKRESVTVEPRQVDGNFVVGISYFLEPVVGHVEALSSEAVASLQEGDRIIKIGDKRVYNTFDVAEILSDNPNIVTFTLLRGTEEVELSFQPIKNSEGANEYRFSFMYESRLQKGLSLFKSVKSAFDGVFSIVRQTFSLIPHLFSGSVRAKEAIAGPIRISFVIGEMRNAGLRSFLQLLAAVSASLAIANLLPIPGLDGGAILLSFIALVLKREISVRLYYRYQSIGLALLLILMIFVLYQDIGFLFSGW